MLRAIPYTSLWFGLILWFVFGGSLTTAAVWWLYEDYLFTYDSKPTTAIVDRLYTTTSHGRHGSTTTYHIQYHYSVGNLLVGCMSTVVPDTYHEVAVGGSMPVLYIPARAAHNRIDLLPEQQSAVHTTWGFSLASLVINITGVFICRYYVRQNKLYRFLLASGVQCQGIVDSVLYDFVGKNRTQRFYLTFTFTDSQGHSRSGRSWYLRLGDEARWRTGNPVPVYFDPANSERFTVGLTRGPLNT